MFKTKPYDNLAALHWISSCGLLNIRFRLVFFKDRISFDRSCIRREVLGRLEREKLLNGAILEKPGKKHERILRTTAKPSIGSQWRYFVLNLIFLINMKGECTIFS